MGKRKRKKEKRREKDEKEKEKGSVLEDPLTLCHFVVVVIFMENKQKEQKNYTNASDSRLSEEKRILGLVEGTDG